MKINIMRQIHICFVGMLIVWLGVTIFFTFIKPSVIIVNSVGQGGRLGDQLISYANAKWFSYKYNIPIAVVPFKHYDELVLSQDSCYWGFRCLPMRLLCKLFGRVVEVKTEQDIVNGMKSLNRPTRFVTSIYTDVGTDLYALCMRRPEFRKILKKMFQPITSVEPIRLLSNRITVAVHVRKGGGYDPELSAQQYYDVDDKKGNDQGAATAACTGRSSDKESPNRFPPEQFYVDQIKRLKVLLDKAPLYVYIFTDDKDPQQLTERIKKHVKDNDIVFACRSGGYSYKSCVIEDFAAMMQFDCLIRPASNFSYVAQVVGDFKVVIYPEESHWQDDKILLIDKVSTIINKRFA